MIVIHPIHRIVLYIAVETYISSEYTHMYTHSSSPLHAARDYAHQVIVAISPYLLQCKCVEQLFPHLVRRGVVASKVRSIILSQSDTEAASSLERLRNGISCEPGVEVSMVEGVYLALLDCYEESGSVWCHGMAVSGIQPVGMYHVAFVVLWTNFIDFWFAVRFQLKLPDINFDGTTTLYINTVIWCTEAGFVQLCF